MPTGMESPFGGVSFNLNFSFWDQLLTWSSGKIILALFGIIGWAILLLIFFYMGQELWLWYRQGLYTSKWKWLVLAIEIPQEVIQSPKAVEQLFSHLSGALVGPNVGEKFWLGKKQKWFSFEIISMAGYIQFLIYTEQEFRDVVEAAIYAQYPTAEITEIEDYVGVIPTKFPNDAEDVFGVEFTLAGHNAYPIRTYPEFEHSVTKDAMFNDPMAAVLENFTRLGAGENFFTQIVIEPVADTWQAAGISLVKEIIAQKKAPAKAGILGGILGLPAKLFEMLMDVWNWNFEPKEKEVKREEVVAGKVSELPPGLKNTVQAVEDKIAKVGFKTKIRALYVARKEVFNPSRCLDGYVGSLKQFSMVNRNQLTPYVVTKAYYAFKKLIVVWKKRKFVNAFKKRKIKVYGTPYILNIEELATLWHFPLPSVKTPLLQKSATKRSEPPFGLPIDLDLPVGPAVEEERKEEPPEPEELPYG